MVVLAVAIWAVVLGWALGGRLDGLSQTDLPLRSLMVIAIFGSIVRLVLGLLPLSKLYVAYSAAVLMFVVAVTLGVLSRGIAPVLLLSLGSLLNGLAIVVFGGMPSMWGGDYLRRHIASDAHPIGLVLGDVLRMPLIEVAVSLGDLLLLIGAVTLVVSGMAASQRPGKRRFSFW